MRGVIYPAPVNAVGSSSPIALAGHDFTMLEESMKSDKASSASATSQQANLWSKADFLDRARELKRRLEVWQLDGDEPVYCPRETVAFQTAIKSVFRNRVMLGEHDPHLTLTTQSSIGNSFILNPIDPYAKWVTIWKFRDFVEHLRSCKWWRNDQPSRRDPNGSGPSIGKPQRRELRSPSS